MTGESGAGRARRWRLVLGADGVTPSTRPKPPSLGAGRDDEALWPPGELTARATPPDTGAGGVTMDGVSVDETGSDGADGADASSADVGWSPQDERRDAALEVVYGGESGRADRRRAKRMSPRALGRWLDALRAGLPPSAVTVVQRDAVERLGMLELLFEDELLESLEPDVTLVATMLSLRGGLPPRARAAARRLVARVVEDLSRELVWPATEPVRGALLRGRPTRRPGPREIDWARTIRANLKHRPPDGRGLVLASLRGTTGRQRALDELVLAVDQSGSMAASVVYATVFAAALATLPSLRTTLLAFDTRLADLTGGLDDPVGLLLSAQLGGGTDLRLALREARSRLQDPERAVVVMVSDLFDGVDPDAALAEAARLVATGARLVAVLALDPEGAPRYDAAMAQGLAGLGVPVFAATPDRFGELLAAALAGEPLTSLDGPGLHLART